MVEFKRLSGRSTEGQPRNCTVRVAIRTNSIKHPFDFQFNSKQIKQSRYETEAFT